MSSSSQKEKTTNFRTGIIVVVVAFLILLFVTGVISPVGLFDLVLLQPMLNFLVLVSRAFFGNFGLAIIALTIIVLILTLPLTVRQMRSSKAMQEIQPKLRELQKKYGKDKDRLGEETMKLYKEQGVNPAGCAFTMVIQMPIWIALYQSIIQGLAYAPENLLGLSKQLYSWSAIQQAVPLNSHFLWLDLGRGDLVMAILTGGSLWVQQKMTAPAAAEQSQQSMQNVMLWMMPLLFGFIALSFPSGLALFWVVSTVVRIAIQYRATGWGALRVPSLDRLLPGRGGMRAETAGNPAGDRAGGEGGVVAQQGAAGEDSAVAKGREAVGRDATSQRKRVRHGKRRDKRKVRGRSRRSGSS